MTRHKRTDFFAEIERIEQVLSQLMDAERDAFHRMMAAPPGPAKGAALSSYVGATHYKVLAAHPPPNALSSATL